MVQTISEQDPQQDTAISPRTKKCRAHGVEPSKRRQRGEQRELCQLNLDVLFLIAAYIHPLDLLNLARTCKSLRELLMDRASVFVWKTARHQVQDLPDCPSDLTEPEYAHLAFCASCHGCGKCAEKVLWTIRRRYCTTCKDKRLRYLSSCPDIICDKLRNIFPTESLTMKGEKLLTIFVDKHQVHSFLQEYDRSSDKEKFLNEKREQYVSICKHAKQCQKWETSKHKADLELRRKERDESIFERLKQHGYEHEIAYFGRDEIRGSRMIFFGTSKPLTDKEWAQMWPEWFEIMKAFRAQRIHRTVYQPRRRLLILEYDSYITRPLPNTPISGFLPHIIELGCFPPFRDIIKAPEGAEIGAKPFESAFAQLPVLVDQWQKQAEAELAALVKIPSHLSSRDVSGNQGAPSAGTIHMEPPQSSVGKLRLACAVFNTSNLSYYPDVFSTMLHYVDPIRGPDKWECDVPVQKRLGIKHVESAPFVVHACGLDPHVATVDDMDRRNARLRCLLCNDPYIRCWRGALYHAAYSHPGATTFTMIPRWQIVDDKYTDAIQSAEQSAVKDFPARFTRCLLCRPRVGDSMPRDFTITHLIERHEVAKDDIKQGLHYVPVDIGESHTVEMVEERGRASFRMVYAL